jgi:ABC-type amino acid transport system permease subunit
MPCPYATLLGEPGKGVHAARWFGIARNDTIMTIIAAIVTSFFLGVPLLYSILGWFLMGEGFHLIFGTPTAVLKAVGLDPKCD